jgi:hypothetical protein
MAQSTNATTIKDHDENDYIANFRKALGVGLSMRRLQPRDGIGGEGQLISGKFPSQ